MGVVSTFNLVLRTNQSVTITPDLIISLSKHQAITPTFNKPSSHKSSAINKATYLAQFIRCCLFCCFSKHAVAACNQLLLMHVHAGTHSSSSRAHKHSNRPPRDCNTSLTHPLELSATHSSFHFRNRDIFRSSSNQACIRIITAF